MHRRASTRRFAAVLALPLTLLLALISARPAAADPALELYVSKLRPLLATRCFACHGALAQEAGLRLDTAELMRAGGDSGSAVTAGDPAASLILGRVSDTDPATRMPPEGEGESWSPAELALLRTWIEAGCPAPPDERPEADPREHWAFQPVVRPQLPAPPADDGGPLHPIDALLGAARTAAGVVPQPPAPRHVLIRRVYLDLIGLPPQPEELAALEADAAPDWYERLVDRLLADPRHGERWGRHWMDVWRYSDWWGLGDQLRNSQPHMWHFRDWIVESLNADVGYDEMLRQMLAADELYPDDLDKLRATGFLARNWFLFNRTPWMDDTVEHVAKGVLGLTVNCAKCHAHKYDPIPQEDYYRFRAFFEPLQVRLDVVPGEGDLARDGVPRVFDAQLDAPTYLFVRGNDAQPDTSRPIAPGVPRALCSAELPIAPVELPLAAYEPQRRPWALAAHVATAERRMNEAAARQVKEPSLAHEQALAVARAELFAVEQRVAATQASWAAQQGTSLPEDPLRIAAEEAARAAAQAEREVAVVRARGTVDEVAARLAAAVAENQPAEARASLEQELAAVQQQVEQAMAAVADAGTSFAPLFGAKWTPTRFQHSGADDPTVAFPAASTGRRTALAHWIADARNPLTARVAVNHIWLRHMGAPLVATVFDFGRQGSLPAHPELLDWLASELVDGPPGGPAWSMKHMHRLIVTSAAYRLSSSLAGAEAAAKRDPDNQLWWRRPPQRLEAQVVRDALLALAGTLDATRGGPPVPEAEQATSRRRSLYFWHSDISRNALLTSFDDAAVKECYQRDQSIVPQQALALSNSALALDAAADIARRIVAAAGPTCSDDDFLDRAFVTVLCRPPTPGERAACGTALAAWRAGVDAPLAEGIDAARVRVVWALVNHNDFVTLR